MANLKKLIDIIEFITQKDPNTLIDDIAVEHDTIYLPIPANCSEKELEQKGEELGFILEDASIMVYL